MAIVDEGHSAYARCVPNERKRAAMKALEDARTAYILAPAKHGPGLKRAIRRFRGRYVGPVFALEALMLQLGTKRREFDR